MQKTAVGRRLVREASAGAPAGNLDEHQANNEKQVPDRDGSRPAQSRGGKKRSRRRGNTDVSGLDITAAWQLQNIPGYRGGFIAQSIVHKPPTGVIISAFTGSLRGR